jgi:hypothetical protein
VKEREQSARVESLWEKTKRWFWQGSGLIALAVGAVVVVNHLPELIAWTGKAITYA